MVKHSSRSGRLSDLLQRELSMLIRDECTDPRIGMVTISGVQVTDDLSFARVYVTVLQDDKQKASLDALNHAAGFFRTELSKRSNLRSVPKLKFIYDDSLHKGYRVDMLLNSVLEPTSSHEPADDETE